MINDKIKNWFGKKKETPTEPVVETPTEPVVETPTEPVVETPTEPVVETPDKGIPATSIAPAVTKRVLPYLDSDSNEKGEGEKSFL